MSFTQPLLDADAISGWLCGVIDVQMTRVRRQSRRICWVRAQRRQCRRSARNLGTLGRLA
jgi:hypothetical protein